MAKMIDADDLWHKTFICEDAAEVRKFIENAPRVDAVEVVRCKVCSFSKYFEDSGTRICRTQKGLCRTVADDEFCSYGERRNDG